MNELLPVKLSYLIPLLPLIGAVLAGCAPKKLRPMAHWPIWIGVGLSSLLSLSLLGGMLWLWVHGTVGNDLTHIQQWYTWIDARSTTGDFASRPGFVVNAAAWFDPLTAVMLSVVTGIGLLITIYAAGYMHGEAGYFRFFAYLGLFIFSMTILVMGNNFVMLYLGWEGVGVCSYLLIGYYYEKPSAREAAKKAFLVNRIGDFGFGLGIMLIFLAFGTINFFGDGGSGVLQMAGNLASLTAFQKTALQIIPFLLMLGAFGKSAQFPLYVWLPDAMEGPTPVSALIHAATMVTAGVYMIARCGPIFLGSTAAMQTIAAIGAFTALLAGLIALRQWDLKKVFAYSTISQLGYMFIGLGVLAPTAAVFHLVTHAFFKALLFLSSGVVMHAMLGHLDMRKMSGLRHKLPMTNILMLIGCAALAGFPLTSGFFSKDEIIGETWRHSTIIGLVALFTAFLTAYYTFRLYFQVFQGPLIVPSTPADGHAPEPSHDQHGGHPQGSDDHAPETAARSSHSTPEPPSHDAADHAHAEHNPEPNLMIAPLMILAIGALFGGVFNTPFESLARFLGNSPSFQLGYTVAQATAKADGTPAPDHALFGQKEDEGSVAAKESAPVIPGAMLVGAAVSIAGISLAYWLHLKNRPLAEKVAANLQPLTHWIEAKFWVDELYQHTIVHSLRELGQAFYMVDRYIVDGLVSIAGFLPMLPGFGLKLSTQRGYLQGYATVMLLGLAAILFFIFVHG
jgi:NADH-quinone oxidoreductase subunit L